MSSGQQVARIGYLFGPVSQGENCSQPSAHTFEPRMCVQFKIEPFKHPLKMDPTYGGNYSRLNCLHRNQWL